MKRRRKTVQSVNQNTLTALNLGARGDAIFDGPVYARGVLPGEKARLEIRGQRGRVLQRLNDHPDRVDPFCAVADQCGGCSLQHFEERAYRDWKRGLAQDAMHRAGIDHALDDLIDAHGQGRRRAGFHAQRFGKKLVFGFHERAGERIADLNTCPAVVPQIGDSICDFRDIADALTGPKGRLEFAVTACESGLDVHITGVRDMGLAGRELLAERAHKRKWARVTVNGEPVIMLSEPYVKFGHTKVVPPPGGFLQATSAGEAALADQVMHAFQGCNPSPKRAVDLFSGSGAFALRLAEYVPVFAVEGAEGPLNAIKSAVARANGLKPVEARVRDLALEPISPKELESFDFAVIDPPRSGAQAQCEALADSQVSTICSISCNPVSFARDARILMDAGFQIENIKLIDQFKWTPHLEIAAILTRS